MNLGVSDLHYITQRKLLLAPFSFSMATRAIRGTPVSFFFLSSFSFSSLLEIAIIALPDMFVRIG